MNSWGYVTLGAIANFFGLVMLGPLGVLTGGNAVGWIVTLVLLGAGSIMLPIGVIGVGVRIGSREAALDQARIEEAVASRLADH